MKGSGSIIGYRAMHQRLVNHQPGRMSSQHAKNCWSCLRWKSLKVYRLKWRQYGSKGPNYIWHTDGYDKLKPFVFCIHGCIDAGIQPAYYLVGSWGYQQRPRRHGGILGRDSFCWWCTTNFACRQWFRKFFTLQCFSEFFEERQLMHLPRKRVSCQKISLYNQPIETWWDQLRRSGVDF